MIDKVEDYLKVTLKLDKQEKKLPGWWEGSKFKK